MYIFMHYVVKLLELFVEVLVDLLQIGTLSSHLKDTTVKWLMYDSESILTYASMKVYWRYRHSKLSYFTTAAAGFWFELRTKVKAEAGQPISKKCFEKLFLIAWW